MERLIKKIDSIRLNVQLYNYLVSELYPVPSCDNCHYSDPQLKRFPCDKCDESFSKFKLHKGHEADLRKMVREILKITKCHNR